MKINSKSPEVVRPEPSRPLTGSQPAIVPEKAQPGAARAQKDSVEISSAGRTLAESVSGTSDSSSSLSADRIADIRKKLLEGAYDSVQVVDEVAKRILGRGDV